MNTKKTKKKNGSKLLKILILVVVLSLVAVAGIAVSDIIFPTSNKDTDVDTITIRVSSTDIFLNGDEKVTLTELENHLNERYDNKDFFTIALINDTKHPADIDTYNAVVEILGKFGIQQEPLTLPATNDEATKDQI